MHDSNAPLTDRRKSPPQPFHFVAINARRGVDQLCRVNEVRGATGVDVNRRTEFRETPGSAGVIKVDVAKKHMPHISGRETSFLELFGDIRAAKLVIEEGVTFVGKSEVNPNKVAPVPPAPVANEVPKLTEPVKAGRF